MYGTIIEFNNFGTQLLKQTQVFIPFILLYHPVCIWAQACVWIWLYMDKHGM